MISSMTGYGKAQMSFRGNHIEVEIRSVNGKTADINLKSASIPKSKEPEVRQLLSSCLHRGSIDLFVTVENNNVTDRLVNRERFNTFYHEMISLQKEYPKLSRQKDLLSTLFRIPEVMERKNHEPDNELWSAIVEVIRMAIEQVHLFRATEGAQLATDILQRIAFIESNIYKVEEYEVSRIDVIKERLFNRLNELRAMVQPDQNRLEQELIYYLEKWDITEEKVRLRQHCAFFKKIVMEEKCQGRKLLFVTQEMGREINTLGSKANHAIIQQWVVVMKDELEKIKEQLLNIL